MQALIYALSYLAFPLFGWSLAAKIEDRPARIGFAFLAGGWLLTVEATLFTICGLRWSIVGLSAPLLVASGLVAMRSGRAEAAGHGTYHLPSILLIILALAHFALSVYTGQAASPDFVLYWGGKAVNFAASHSLDPAFLHSSFPPPKPEFPPLVPVVQAWGLLFTHEMPWLTAAAMSALWLLAAVPVVRWVTRSWEATAFWAAAMAASHVFSGCGGNAEAMLVAYLTVGAAALARNRLSIAAIAFAGAALTKEQSLVTIAAVVAAVIIGDRHVKRAAILAGAALASTSVWFLYQKRFAFPIGYARFQLPKHLYWGNLPLIFREMPKNLAAGCWGLAWLIPLLVIILVAVRAPRRLASAIPLLLPVPLLFAFFLYLHIHFPSDVAMYMWWILPRISQPAMSLMIVGAAVASSQPHQ